MAVRGRSGPRLSPLLAALPGVALAVSPVLAAAQSAPAIDTLRLRAVASVLAHDSMGGRATGSRGARLAAVYIAGQLEALGLRPVGPDFLEPVPLETVRLGPGTQLRVTDPAGGPGRAFAHGEDFLMTGGRSTYRDVAGPVLFLGSPAHIAANAVDRDLRGRVVAIAGTLGGAAVTALPVLRAAGVVAVVELAPDGRAYAAMRAARAAPPLVGAADVEDPVWQPAIPVLVASPALTRALLAAVRIPALVPEAPFEPIDTQRGIDVRFGVDFEPVDAVNVIGLLPGTDPSLADAVVAYTAHYDHLGTGEPDARGDSIYNGFTDNAAGVAMLLGIAAALAEDRPAHSTLFLFFTGEERGLLGSTHWAAHPTVPLERVHALINLDGGAPPRPPVSWRIANGLDQPLGEIARQVAARRGWTVNLTEAAPNSDHWPFQRRGVPTVFIIPGNEWEATTPAERTALRARWDRYHTPGDAFEVDYPFAGIARYASFALEVGRAAIR